MTPLRGLAFVLLLAAAQQLLLLHVSSHDHLAGNAVVVCHVCAASDIGFTPPRALPAVAEPPRSTALRSPARLGVTASAGTFGYQPRAPPSWI